MVSHDHLTIFPESEKVKVYILDVEFHSMAILTVLTLKMRKILEIKYEGYNGTNSKFYV